MSLIAWLPLNGNLNNQGIGTITTSGTPSYNTGKLSTQALNLSTRVSGNIPELVGAKTWSIAFWCLTKDDDTLSSDWVDILGVHDRKSDDSATGEFRWETCYGSSKGVAIGQYNNATYATMTTNGGTLQGTKGAWHHCVASTDFENGTVSIYLDGVLKYTRVHAGGWLLGDYWLGQNNAVNGSIQDVRFYNHALSVKEVKELAKGLCMHLPLDWGGNPNMIKNSYTWMNKSAGSSNQWTNSGLTYDSSTVVENDAAPCRWVMKRVITNTKTSNVSGAGCFYGIGAKGLATTDLTENEYYTYSFWAKSDSGVSSGFTAGSVVEGQTLVSNTGFGALNGNWRLHTVTFKFTKTTSLTNCFYITVPASSTVDFQVCGMKLEKGQKATPYLPNVEETAYINNNYSSIITEDCSGYGNNGTLGTGISSNSNTPKYSTSTAFTNTNGGITKVPCPLSDSSTDLSISCWIYLNEITTNKAIYNARTVAGAGISIFTLNNPNNIRFDTGNTITAFSYSFTANTWTHLVVTKTPTEKKLYINGELKQTVSANTTMTNVAEKGSIGVSSLSNAGTSTSSNYFNGSMSDFRIYATALSADDIKELYNVAAQIDKNGNMYCGTLVEE